jgi:site-specific recombinase XerD
VQKLLGHRSIETPAVYMRVGVEDLREVLRRSHPRERGT